MGPIVSVAIMAHPKRKHFVDQLLCLVPEASVVWDQRNDRWDTGRRSMLAFNPAADWHLVIQDDAILCIDFMNQVRRALQYVENGPVSFYLGRTMVGGEKSRVVIQKARAKRCSWIVAPGPHWGVGVAIRPADIEPMISWGDKRSDIQNYDIRMARYFLSKGRGCWYSVPSLVNHRVGKENPSLVEGRGASPGRQTLNFLDRGITNWTRKALVLSLR